MEVAIPLFSFLLLGECFFDLKLGRGMAISPSLEEEHNHKKNGVDHLTIPYGRLIRMEVAISLFLNSEGGWPSPHPLTENNNNGLGHIPIPVMKSSRNGGGHPSLSLSRILFLDEHSCLLL